ncbi:hypothetical protein BDY21DRAFT_385186 [Lineolata rhizophorae]|uniref:Glucose-methanol-choline oxidoreductase N-terminal domain-containing protein n=1 Tax=Lineolata rhizophorae TaxID=578093 RepID=A0A6A6P4F6_9PEZI|nr:hypothetical protein BDY21DRAFT_385186 [Lineolata rhizophorae]
MARLVMIVGVVAQLLSLYGVCLGYPHLTNQFLKRQIDASSVKDSYDYIVVGGGQSGLVIANRLSEDESKTVLCVEYGYFDNRPSQIEPASAVDYEALDMYNWTTVPLENLGGREVTIFAAAVVGGGSMINGMLFDRGAAEDYDNWEALGNPGWGFEGLLPFFKKSAQLNPPSQEVADRYGITWDLEAAYGTEPSPIQARYADFQYPGALIQWDGFVEAGAEPQIEGAAGNAYGVFWAPGNYDENVTRSSATSGYWQPASNRPNLDFLVGHRVNTVQFTDDLHAESVEIQERDGTAQMTVRANTEIVLSAGWVNDPQILQRSGIGPAATLEAAGIQVLKDLPGVGMNLQDHSSSRYSSTYQTDVTPSPSSRYLDSNFSEWAQTEWEENRGGPTAQGVGNLMAQLPLTLMNPDGYQDMIDTYGAQNAAEFLPKQYGETVIAGYEAQREVMKASMASPKNSFFELPFNGGGSFSMVLQKPLSRGYVAINPDDHYGNPVIDYQTLKNPVDVGVVVSMVRMLRRWIATDAMQQLSPMEILPGPSVTEDDAIASSLTQGMSPSIAHSCCTSAMMSEDMGGVVGPDLLVHGVTGLSVADGSVMPLIPATHLCASTYAVAEKAADVIKNRGSASRA